MFSSQTEKRDENSDPSQQTQSVEDVRRALDYGAARSLVTYTRFLHVYEMLLFFFFFPSIRILKSFMKNFSRYRFDTLSKYLASRT